jgi:hypothetical protein
MNLKDVEGNGRGLILDEIPDFSGLTEENHDKPDSG